MGALSFWGGVAGAGRGIASIGEQMSRDDDRRARLEEQQQFQREMREEQRQAEIEREQRRAAAAPTTSSGGGARSSAGGMSLSDLAARPDLLSLAGGESRESIDDAIALSQGKSPMRPVAEDDGSGFSATEVPKYTPGEASALMARAKSSLWEAMKVANPDKADDLSKSQRTDQGTRFAAEYRATGDERAGGAAYVNDSKPAYDDGSSVASGRAAKGSVAEAKIGTERAKAGAEGALAAKRGEERKTEVDKREGKASIKDDLALVDGQRKKIDSRLSDIRARESTAMKMGDDAELVAAREERKKVQQQADALDTEYTRLTQRLSDRGDKAAPGKPSAGGAPPASMLKDGVRTKFKDGSSWTLRNGKPVRID